MQIAVDQYVSALPVPEADAIFAPRVLTQRDGCCLFRFVYDADQKLVEWAEH